jgi:hypothetical protein
MKTVVERLHFLRKKGQLRSKRAAAEAYGIGYEVYKKIEVHDSNDPRNLTKDQADQIARYHRVSPGWIMFGTGEMSTRNAGNERTVPLSGRIGAGQEVVAFERDETENVSVEIGDLDGRAFQVIGPSMMPLARDGDYIFVGPERKDFTSLLGLECAVHLRDGRTFFKVLTNGSRKGRYTLISYNADPIVDVQVESAGPFLGLRRGSALRSPNRR